ncbi:hypothetical protein MSHO_01240 [Mycobacterium shottsii]|uniref:Uncharacterized protein n=1 Tax=Mycobacterium shottsii TaxID=133549 RepID=A0A7I7L5R9_9MYCO|nr:hypothetical protein MSHO_01240 [Mycobacterium shottsii]
MTVVGELPSSSAVQTACASLMARAALGGVIPSAWIWARKASSVEPAVAVAVAAKPSAARPRLAAVRVVPAREAAKRRVNILDSFADLIG